MITISLPPLEYKLEGRGHNHRVHSCTHSIWCRKDAQIKMVLLAPKMSLIKSTHIKDAYDAPGASRYHGYKAKWQSRHLQGAQSLVARRWHLLCSTPCVSHDNPKWWAWLAPIYRWGVKSRRGKETWPEATQSVLCVLPTFPGCPQNASII